MFEVAENQIQDAVPVTLTTTEQSFLDAACQELGFQSRQEFLQRAVIRLAELKTAWPDSFRLLMAT